MQARIRIDDEGRVLSDMAVAGRICASGWRIGIADFIRGRISLGRSAGYSSAVR
jgi:hypothetical protein